MDSELNILSPPATPPLDFNKVRAAIKRQKSHALHAKHTHLADANEILHIFFFILFSQMYSIELKVERVNRSVHGCILHF